MHRFIFDTVGKKQLETDMPAAFLNEMFIKQLYDFQEKL